jgi:AraC family transcriptional regulator
MIARLPPTSKAANKSDARGSERQSWVLHEKGQREYYWQGEGWLSIKSFRGGTAFYNAGQGHFAVDHQHYLVLNQGQPYSITIESEIPMESFCVFFKGGLAEDVHRNLTSGGSLLDDPDGGGSDSINFFEKTYRHDDILTPALAGLRGSLSPMKNEPGWLDEQLHGVMERLLQVHMRVRREAESLAAARPATREELYRRLSRARDYMLARLDQPVPLDEMARVACLSPNHFIRTFRQAFGQSPHQYLVSRRLERAEMLLAGTQRPVTEVCYSVGFESLGSFSWLFRKRYGVSPTGYRLQKS